MTIWLKQNLVAVVAVVVSVGTLTFSNVSGSAASTTSINERLGVVEEQVKELKPITERMIIIESEMKGINTTLRLAKNADLRQSRSLEGTKVVVAELEKSAAVTNQILKELTGAVSDLSVNTKELTKVVTKVAVLDEKVQAIRDDMNRRM